MGELPGGGTRGHRSVAVVTVAVVGLVAVGLAWVVAKGGSGATAASASGAPAAAEQLDHRSEHLDDAGSAHRSDMAGVDNRRCDRGFNPRAYWEEAAAMGVDTYEGGTMSMARADTSTAPDQQPPGLAELVAQTDRAASGGEVDASRLVATLGAASDDVYRSWRSYMRGQMAFHPASGHSHDATAPAAPDDNGGHGGHLGPQPWVAMVDQDQCVQLAQELAEARKVALSMPTAKDAIGLGYQRITPYLPGIGAHYMKFSEVDDEFHVDRPEMVLYDGNGIDAHVVGLSYYVLHPGDDEPEQGFAGDNDHYHRHVGLCTRPGDGVIGDSTTSAEACAEMGGVKADGGAGWMSHAWVVPGCESPWGVFSGENPVLDGALGHGSGEGSGGCSESASRHRYDLRPGARASSGGATGR